MAVSIEDTSAYILACIAIAVDDIAKDMEVDPSGGSVAELLLIAARTYDTIDPREFVDFLIDDGMYDGEIEDRLYHFLGDDEALVHYEYLLCGRRVTEWDNGVADVASDTIKFERSKVLAEIETWEDVLELFLEYSDCFRKEFPCSKN